MKQVIFVLLFIKCAAVTKFELKTSHLDHVYRRAAITALLKAKAKFELEKLPPTERVLFNQCQNDARSPAELARCLRRLLQQKGSNHVQIAIQAQLDKSPLLSEESWLSSFLKLTTLAGKHETIKTKQAIPALIKPRDPRRYKQVLRFKLNQKFHRVKKLKFQDRTLFPKARVRRRISSEPTSPRCKTPENLIMLRKVEKYFENANECLRYIKMLGLENSNFLASMFPVLFKNEDPDAESVVNQLKAIVDQADSSFSLLSPRIMSLLPASGSDGKLRVMSPNLLSFHEEGKFLCILPLPRLLKFAGSNECETQEWIDLIMKMTGASHKLDQMLGQFQQQMKTIQEDLLPKIKKFQEQEKLIRTLNKTLSREQQNAMRKYGYAHLNDVQLEMVYKDYRPSHFSKSNPDQFLEQLIYELAEFEPSKNASKAFELHQRRKRQANKEKREFGVLEPFAFVNLVGQPSIWGNMVLSPHAFINDLLSPRFLGSDIISPRAFIASTLSPFAMVARVLSPAAFRSQVLTPEALNAYILTPEAFLAIVLSPATLEAQIASPHALKVEILVHSPNYLSVAVLSPSILAFNLASHGALNLEILSPEILVADDGHKHNF